MNFVGLLPATFELLKVLFHEIVNIAPVLVTLLAAEIVEDLIPIVHLLLCERRAVDLRGRTLAVDRARLRVGCSLLGPQYLHRFLQVGDGFE